MQFTDWTTFHAIARLCGVEDAATMPAAAWYDRNVREERIPDPFARAQQRVEQRWLLARRPYYSVWPGISEALCKLRLDIDGGQIKLPVPELLVRLPAAHPLPLPDDRKLHGMLVAEITVRGVERGMALWMNFGDTMPIQEHTIPIYGRLTFALRTGSTIETTLQDLDEIDSDRDSSAAVEHCVRLACTLCLLGDNPDVIRPDVLEADRAKYDATHDEKYPAKAVRRGKVGWDVGRDLEPVIERGEVSPHYRRPHVGLRWTGEGRTLPRVVPISGSIVRRGKMLQVPTGHLDGE